MLQFLLTLADESDHDRVEELYNKYYNYFLKCSVTKFKAAGRSNCVCDAEDAVQNTFMKIIKYLSNIDFSRGEKDVKSYCLAILSNEICNILNESQEKYEFFEELCSETEYNFVDELEVQEQYDRILEAAKGLDIKYSTTLQLFFSKGMTPAEIAETMGISTKTVYTRIARGKKLLLESLEEVETNE